MPTIAAPARKLDRRLYWSAVAGWAIASWLIGDVLSQHMKWRINELSAVPGAGMIRRDAEGVFYYVSGDDKATPIFRPDANNRTSDSEAQTAQSGCLDCTLVTGEQLAQTNDFCAAGVSAELPKIEFEVPCKSWAPINEGPKVMGTVIFLVPLLALPLLRMILQAGSERRRKAAGKRPSAA